MAKSPRKTRVLGCDAGKKGAIVILDGRGNPKWKFPVPLKKDSSVDIMKIRKFLMKHARYIKMGCIEETHAIQRASKGAMFTMGRVLGILEATIISCGIPLMYASPRVWQREIWEEGDRVDRDTKATSMKAQKRLFPRFDATRTPRSIKPDDNLIDALLIAEYCRRNMK